MLKPMLDRLGKTPLTHIVKTQHATPRKTAGPARTNGRLSRRPGELAASNRFLERTIARSKGVEIALKKSGRHDSRLLKESLQLQQTLRNLTHKILARQEKERRTMSHQLQDEIAQSLLGVHVRLLNLKTAAKGNRATLTKEIASTQKIVEDSIQLINRFVRELGIRRSA